jgi:hypothetical protein
MGTTEDRHTIRITGIERIPLSTVIRVKPRWAQSTNPPCVYVSPAGGKRLHVSNPAPPGHSLGLTA